MKKTENQVVHKLNVHTALRWQVRFWKISLSRLDKYLEQMRMCVCTVLCTHHFIQRIAHAEAGCALCTFTDTIDHMIHHDTFLSFYINKDSVSLHQLRRLLMLLVLFQARLCLEDVVECQSKCVLCLRISNHLQLNTPWLTTDHRKSQRSTNKTAARK